MSDPERDAMARDIHERLEADALLKAKDDTERREGHYHANNYWRLEVDFSLEELMAEADM